MATSVPLGIVSLKAEGAYSADKLYKKGMWVTSSGSSYAYIHPTPAAGVPVTDTSHWQQIAEKGDTGPQGEQGPQGVQGEQGPRGEKGDKGDRVELTGPWDELTTYSYYQSAEFYGSSYIYINATPSAGHTPLDTDYWMLWAARGEQFVDTTNLTWQGVRDVVRQGLGPKAFPVGSVLRTTHTTYGDILWRVMAHNHDIHKADPTRPTMRLEMISCIYNMQVDAPELLWANTGASELPAGTYNFALLKADYAGDIREDGTYQFTTEQAIPVGGGFRHSQAGAWKASTELYVPANIIGDRLTTYNASGEAIESNLSVTVGSGGTALGTASRNWADTINIIGRFNSTQRNAYGSNNAGESGVRQWLNSDLGANLWWVKKTPFDLEPSYANQPGFLAGFDADFLDALVTVDNICARNTIYEEGGTLGGSYVTTDKMFRPSMTELGLGVNNAIAEGAVLDYYEGTTALERIKFDIAIPATARYWWLRSPHPSLAHTMRYILPDGALHNHHAYNGYGVAPDCVIG